MTARRGRDHGSLIDPHLCPHSPELGRAACISPKQERSGGDAMALSDALDQLAARARAIEQNVRESEAKGRADLEARAGEARKTADQHTEQLRARSAQSSDEAGRSWNDVQRSWKEHVARIRKRIDDRKAELDLE